MPRSAATPGHNEIRLVGVLTTDPHERTTAGDRELVTFRLDVGRPAEAGGGRDEFECSVQAARTRRAATSWKAGDVVEVEGAVRRRFYRGAAGNRPFFVVEATRARRVGPR